MIKTIFIRNITEEEQQELDWLRKHYQVGRYGSACRKAVIDVRRLEDENDRLNRKFVELQKEYNQMKMAISQIKDSVDAISRNHIP